MAEIFLARQLGLEGFEKELVIKRILPHLAAETGFVRMFLDEARIAARLNHPNIAQIYNLGSQGGTYFIAMEYLDGRSLAERWHGKERLRYAVTPRFSLATTPGLLESCAALLGDVEGALFTSHVNENPAEVAAVAQLFPECAHYVDTYDRFDLLGRRSVLAHSVHPTDAELDELDLAPGITPKSRLGCQTVPDGTTDIVVEIPDWNKNYAKEADH